MPFLTRFLKAVTDNLTALGLVIAVSAFGASLTPTLMPRDPMISGLLGGVVAALGYEVGNWLVALWYFLDLPPLSHRARRRVNIAALVLSLGIVVYSVGKAADWQNATRTAIGLAPVETSYPLEILSVALGVGLVLWLVFRLLGMARRGVGRRLDRVMPRRVGMVLSTVVVLYLFWALVDGALVRTAFRIADASFEAADSLIDPDVPQPSDPLKTGSDASLIRWSEMGRLGRSFVASAPGRAEIAAFTGGPALDPVRVYVGRRAADTAEDRTELALKELIRAGGFERSVLVVAVPVGSGWMDPGAHDTLDFMFGGDVATVAVQYSYLTSVLSLLAHPEYGTRQARSLFDAVYDHWTKLPRATRPKLYVHGLSQGAYNSQATLPLLDMLSDPIEGAMWAGSPFFARYWSEVRDNRNPESPAWRPTYGNGSLIRVIDQYGGLESDFAPWGPIRVVFLNYGSDPIVNFTYDSAFLPPAWLNKPRSPDVSDRLSWFPIVTMLQLALDSAVSLQVPRHGHDYVAPDYIDAWAAVTDPPDWSKAKSDALKKIFNPRGNER